MELTMFRKLRLKREYLDKVRREVQFKTTQDVEKQYKHQIKVLKTDHIKEMYDADREHKFQLKVQKSELEDEYKKDRKEVEKTFLKEFRELKFELARKNEQLKRAQKGFLKYLDFAVKAFFLTKELRAEAQMWMLSGNEYYQKMSKINDKFEEIERFNTKNEPLIKELLSFHNESDDDLLKTLEFTNEKILHDAELDLESGNFVKHLKNGMTKKDNDENQ